LGFGYNGQLDQLRSEQFRHIGSTTYLDHAAATLYSSKQLQLATEELLQQLFVNPHSQQHAYNATAAAIDELRHLTLRMCNARADQYEASSHSSLKP
jgi:selenocysteine lyase/cysteine desulfurase